MLRSRGVKTHWFQLAQGLESLLQGREIQVGLERIVVLVGAHLEQLQLGEGPESSHEMIGLGGWCAGR